MFQLNEVVWLTEERTYGFLINMGAFFSLVRYTMDGIDYEVPIENDEIVFGEDHVTEYESE